MATLPKLFRPKSERFWHSLKKIQIEHLFASEKKFLPNATLLSCRIEFCKPGRQFPPEIKKLFDQCPKKSMKLNFFQVIFRVQNPLDS